ncbi:MAG: hypothetical protein EBX94_02735, partial [Burkholderiaceae bacterium]|nr:hypothetical protein [Burkholderiaceae bacterium]
PPTIGPSVLRPNISGVKFRLSSQFDRNEIIAEEKQKLAQQEQSRKKTGAVTSPAIQTRQPLNSSNASSSSATIK